jgi:esterase/lipase superfamily enzyme
MVVVTWPSDKEGVDSYQRAEKEEENAVTLVPLAINVTEEATKLRPSVIAHSMGARLYADGVESMTNHNNNSATMLATILAAPDVDNEVFKQRFKAFQVWNSATTVYCAEDRALKISGLVHWDRRLGYCRVDDPNSTTPEEFVRITGKVKDTWRHSYFLSAPEMIYDMKSVLSNGENDSETRGAKEFPPRTLELR